MNYKIRFLNGDIKEFTTLRGANLRKANLREANLREANLRNADLYGADLEGADLYGADLGAASLYGANLGAANLYGANLSEASLRGANLRDADLRGADLFNTSIISFQIGKHFGFYHESRVKIGCQDHTLDHWLENYDKIGTDSGYNSLQIRAYGIQLRAIKEMIA